MSVSYTLILSISTHLTWDFLPPSYLQLRFVPGRGSGPDGVKSYIDIGDAGQVRSISSSCSRPAARAFDHLLEVR